MAHYINNEWIEGRGSTFHSTNPATGRAVWSGHAATREEVGRAVTAAKKASGEWAALPFEKRLEYVEAFQSILTARKERLAKVISEETGKPLWDALSEVGAMINKVPISKEAYLKRCPDLGTTRHKPIGVVGVLGPFNFPGHLPNGHIIPALIAGNTVCLKPSELTPHVAEMMLLYWEECRLPPGVINLVQGDSVTGRLLVEHPMLDGLFFTGSYKTGLALAKQFADHPEKILALEMGGNNPLVIGQISDYKAAAYLALLSAYLSAGQRCTCARRLIIPEGPAGERFLEAFIPMVKGVTVGPYTQKPEPFMGPLINNAAAEKMLKKQQELIDLGAVPLVTMEGSVPFLTPGLIDVTPLRMREDEELFGPLLQVIRVNDFNDALTEANNTKYGLTAGLLSDDPEQYRKFYQTVRAGVINWNTQLTGASSHSPFGGVGRSGNHRPSAFYAADYCSYPVASTESAVLKLPETLSPGLHL